MALGWVYWLFWVSPGKEGGALFVMENAVFVFCYLLQVVLIKH